MGRLSIFDWSTISSHFFLVSCPLIFVSIYFILFYSLIMSSLFQMCILYLCYFLKCIERGLGTRFVVKLSTLFVICSR